MAVDVKLPEGTVIGNWTLRDELGRGGQGVVWGAKSRATKRHPPMALKACFASEATDRARFEREIALLHQCKDATNILRITDSDPTWVERVPGVPACAYYVSELCDGSLEEREKKLGDAGARLDLFREACAAVQYLHTRDEPLLHRDIKPANFLLAKEPRRLVLADFGIARPLASTDGLTQIHEVVGTQHFRAPEVLACQPPTLQSDIYSLGRVLEWLLTGAVSQDLGTHPVPRGGRLSDAACDLLDKVIATATQPVASKRYVTVDAMIAALPDLWLDVRQRPGGAVATARTADDAYAAALALAKADDRPGWRTVELDLKKAYVADLLAWRKENEYPTIPNIVALRAWFANVVPIAAPRIALALGGVMSQKDAFIDQRRTLEHLLDVPGWSRGGTDVTADAPFAIAYLFHYLHGALCCELLRHDLALQFAFTLWAQPDEDNKKQKPVWRSVLLNGWAKSLKGPTSAAEFLRGLYDQMNVLGMLFGSRRDYEIAIASYSLLLSLVELTDSANDVSKMTGNQISQIIAVEVPPMFLSMDDDVVRTAGNRTIGNADVVTRVLGSTKKDRAALVSAWPNWKRILKVLRRDPFGDDLPLGDLG